LSVGGCTFCNNNSFNPFYCKPEKSITSQINDGIAFHSGRRKVARKYLAYFQSYSNTYASVAELEQKYTEALNHPLITGIVIGTRPDCIDEEKIELLASISRKNYVQIEYGVESCYDDTLTRINRAHTYAISENAILLTAQKGINTGAHLIFGLPGESREKMLAQAKIISKLPLTFVKLHQLQIIKNTAMAEEYQQYPERFSLFSLDSYIDFIVEFLENLHPDFVIERFTSEAPLHYIIAPRWNKVRHYQIMHMIENRMAQKNTKQGIFFKFNGIAVEGG